MISFNYFSTTTGTSSLSPLSGLTGLQTLYLHNDQISDLSPLSGLTDLTCLSLSFNQVSDLSSLSGLANLQTLDLWGNQINDLSPLSSLANLQLLDLHSNQISSLAPLSGLTNLKWLDLDYNYLISDLSPLSGLTSLQTLRLQLTQVSDVSPLIGLPDLRELGLRHDPLDRDAYCRDLSAILLAAPACSLYYSPNTNPPGGVSATRGTHEDRITLAWDVLCPGPGSTDVFQYRIYRSASSVGTKEPISGWLSGTSYDDTTAVLGVRYWYWVKSDKSGDKYSDPDEGWCGVLPERTLTIGSTAGGTVSAPGVGAFKYSQGSIVDVSATPQASYNFVSWTGSAVTAGKVANAFSADTTVVVDDDYTLQATFTVAPYSLAISSTAGGTVLLPGEGLFVYSPGQLAPISAVAEPGYQFIDWTGTAAAAGRIADPEAAETTVLVDGNYTLQANFAAVKVALTTSSGLGGSVSNPGEGVFEYDPGASVLVQATADDENHYFTHWSGTAVDAGQGRQPLRSQYDCHDGR